MSKSNSARRNSKLEGNDSANSLRVLIYSATMPIENKIVLEDMINKLSQEANTMLDIINDIDKRHQKQLLLGYKSFLQNALEAVNRRLKIA
jgi:hypothetical protein